MATEAGTSVAKWDLSRWQSERTSHRLVQAWIEGFQQVLGMSGANEADVRVMALPPEPEAWERWESPVWFAQNANIAPESRLAIGCPSSTQQAVARWVSGVADLEPAVARDAYLGLVKYATEMLASAANRDGGETTFGDPVDSTPPPSAALGVTCHFALEGETHTIALVPSEMLLVALLSAETGSEGPAATKAIAGPSSEAATIPELALSTNARQNLQILLDVDLELSVSFGRTTLLLQEVLKLSSGSIVELNRSASDPVELLINDSVVARGEVVVVDGNYGVRITEVVSPRQRIRSLL